MTLKQISFVFITMALIVFLVSSLELNPGLQESSGLRYHLSDQRARQDVDEDMVSSSATHSYDAGAEVSRASILSSSGDQSSVSESEKQGPLLKQMISQIEVPRFDGIASELRRNPHGTPRQVIQFAMQSSLIMKDVQTRPISKEELQVVQDFYSDCSLGQGVFQEAPASVQLLCMTNLNEISKKYPQVLDGLNLILKQSSGRTRAIYDFLLSHQSRGT